MSAPFPGPVRNFASITREALSASVLADTSRIPMTLPDAGKPLHTGENLGFSNTMKLFLISEREKVVIILNLVYFAIHLKM